MEPSAEPKGADQAHAHQMGLDAMPGAEEDQGLGCSWGLCMASARGTGAPGREGVGMIQGGEGGHCSRVSTKRACVSPLSRATQHFMEQWNAPGAGTDTNHFNGSAVSVLSTG